MSNVTVLGDDICYGNWITDRRNAKKAAAKNTNSSHMEKRVTSRSVTYGDDLSDFISGIGQDISDIANSDVGKAALAGGLAMATTVVTNRMSPTAKANLANVQAAAGIVPQVVTGTNSTITLPNLNLAPGDTTTVPLLIGGVVLLFVGIFVMGKRKRASYIPVSPAPAKV